MVRAWIVDLLEQKITTRSVNRKLSTLKSYFQFLLVFPKVRPFQLGEIFFGNYSLNAQSDTIADSNTIDI